MLADKQNEGQEKFVRRALMNLEQKVEKMATPIAEELGYELYDVDFVRGRDGNELIITIDKQGGVGLDDCEKVSRALDEPLEEANLTEEAYVLCVSSVGIDRELKKEKDFLRAKGGMIDIKTYAKVEGKKQFCGVLKDYDEQSLTLTIKGTDKVFERKQVAMARMHVSFG